MKTKRALFFLVFCLSALLGFAQQDPQYTQYMFNPLVLNPAYAGSREVINTVLLYRNQWVNLEGAPSTITAALNSPLKNKRMGIGIHIISDKIGPTTLNEYVASYAYRIRMGKGKLSFGLRAGLYDYGFDWNKIDYKDKADVFNSQSQTHTTKPNFDFGMYYYNSSFYAGAAISHLSVKSKKSTTETLNLNTVLVPHVTGTFGKAFEINQMITLRPSAVVRLTNHAPVNLDVNVSALLDEKIWIGLGFRSNQDIVLTAEYNFSKLMRVGYAYDKSNMNISSSNKGTHEIFIGFDIDFFKAKTISPRIFKYN